MRKVERFCLVLLVGFSPMGAAFANAVDVYQFDDPQQQQRYRNLIDEFRCPKCLNTNLAGSDAPIAKDLRRTVHRLVVTEGYDDQQVRDFLQARYGDFVLYDPPLNSRTWLIWFLPGVLVLIGLTVLLWLQRGARKQGPVPLDADQQARLDELLKS